MRISTDRPARGRWIAVALVVLAAAVVVVDLSGRRDHGEPAAATAPVPVNPFQRGTPVAAGTSDAPQLVPRSPEPQGYEPEDEQDAATHEEAQVLQALVAEESTY